MVDKLSEAIARPKQEPDEPVRIEIDGLTIEMRTHEPTRDRATCSRR